MCVDLHQLSSHAKCDVFSKRIQAFEVVERAFAEQAAAHTVLSQKEQPEQEQQQDSCPAFADSSHDATTAIGLHDDT